MLIFIFNIQVLFCITQNLLKSSTESDEDEIGRWTREDLLKWSPFKRLSPTDQNLIIQKCRASNWPQSGPVNLQNLLNPLSPDVQNDIKQVLLLPSLTKVSRLSEEMVKELCGRAKPFVYKNNTVVFRKGGPIDEMLFVVEGELNVKTYPDVNKRTRSKCRVGEDSFIGEELIQHFGNYPSESNKTVKVLKTVHALALVYEDVKHVIESHLGST